MKKSHTKAKLMEILRNLTEFNCSASLIPFPIGRCQFNASIAKIALWIRFDLSSKKHFFTFQWIGSLANWRSGYNAQISGTSNIFQFNESMQNKYVYNSLTRMYLIHSFCHLKNIWQSWNIQNCRITWAFAWWLDIVWIHNILYKAVYVRWLNAHYH